MKPTALATVLLCGLLAAGAADAKKLYKWTDKDGKVHYSDQLPPEAVEQARQEFNKDGQQVKAVERALTPEEKAAADAAKAEAEAARKAAEEAEKFDRMLLMSYPTEADIERSYTERLEVNSRNIDTARSSLASQEKSLNALLAHAADLERAGKPVDDKLKASIAKAREQTTAQEAFLARREAERGEIQTEYDATLGRYRELIARQQAEKASDTP